MLRKQKLEEIRMYTKIVLALVAIGIVMGTVSAGEIGVDSGNDGPAVPVLKMTATQNSVTIENVGTAPMNIGGLQLITKNGNVGNVVGKMPAIAILNPEPFIFTKGIEGNDYKITVPIQNVTAGDKVYLTNGVGNYLVAIVQ